MAGKRKRTDVAAKGDAPVQSMQNGGSHNPDAAVMSKKPKNDTTTPSSSTPDIHIQIITGSYERILHGIAARIPSALLQHGPSDHTDKVTFSDTFLFASHANAIRCLTLSPPTATDKRLLATGSSDERINLYTISTVPPPTNAVKFPSLASSSIAENPRNRSLGALTHHSRAITALAFPSKAKLFSAAEDNTIAISRSRDWTTLSTIKCPIPNVQGRPSGDTASPGEVPAGVNGFAIHPSQKLMLSVGKGEKCMRLWNLMTGRKAGVLEFPRDLLARVGEGKHASGEGRQVIWDEAGEHFVVAFDRGAVLYGIDSQPRAIIAAPPGSSTKAPRSKLHKLSFLPVVKSSRTQQILAVSTEDGRILFFDTGVDAAESEDLADLPECTVLAQLGGAAAGIVNRVKDFSILETPSVSASGEMPWIVSSACSDGAIHLWTLSPQEIVSTLVAKANGVEGIKTVGKSIATIETGERVICLGAFVLDGVASGEADVDTASAAAINDEEEKDASSSDSDDE